MLYKHVFRNALIPLVTGFPAAFVGAFFAGSLLIETLFSLDGLGLLGYESIVRRDYPVVLGSLFLFTLIGLVVKLIADLLYVVVDPRVQFGAVAQMSAGVNVSSRGRTAALRPRRHGAPHVAVAEPARLGALQRNRLGCVVLWMFARLLVGTLAELVSNDRPLVARYEGDWFFPIFDNQPETPFGGDFATPTDWNDPFIREQFAKPGNWALFTLNPYSATRSTTSTKRARPGAAERAELARHRRVGPRHGRAPAVRLPGQHLLRAGADRGRQR